MKNQAFGIEIEMTGLTRKIAADVIAEHFNTSSSYLGGSYDKYSVFDGKGREWKVVHDGSIRAERKISGIITSVGRPEFNVELVTPKCVYSDIDTIQEIVRKLRKAGAIVNDSCGIHVHVDGSGYEARTLRNMVNIVASKEDLIYKALQVDSNRENRYCSKVREDFVKELNNKKPSTLSEIADVWYKPYNRMQARSAHYHRSRYHGLNLHSVFTKGTIEFRVFNSTTHAGKIKAYIQFCLAVSHQALTQRSASPKKTKTTNDKYTFRTWLLRLGLIGDEFATARQHLLDNLEGNIAWRNVR